MEIMSTQACADCKAKKKKCVHRGLQTPTSTRSVPMTRSRAQEISNSQAKDTESFPFTPTSSSASVTPAGFAAPAKEMPFQKGAKRGIKGYQKTQGTKAKARKLVYDIFSSDEEPDEPTPSPSPTVSQPSQRPSHDSDKSLQGSIELSRHAIISQCLKERVGKMEENVKAVQERTQQLEEDVQTAKASAQAVIDLVEEWKRAWTSGE